MVLTGERPKTQMTTEIIKVFWSDW